MTIAYLEFVDFIASGAPPENVVSFRPSEQARARVAELIRRQKTNGLSKHATSELDYCLLIEHLMRLAKAKARKYLKSEIN